VAQERRSQLAARVSAAEQEARSHMSSVQPMIQEHHAGWQRLLSQQKKLDADHHTLNTRLGEAGRAIELEVSTRRDAAARVRDLVHSLQELGTFLEDLDREPLRQPELEPPSLRQAPPSLEAPPLAMAPPLVAAPSLVSVQSEIPKSVLQSPVPVPDLGTANLTSAPADDFDAFLREDPSFTVGNAPAEHPPSTHDEL